MGELPNYQTGALQARFPVENTVINVSCWVVMTQSRLTRWKYNLVLNVL